MGEGRLNVSNGVRGREGDHLGGGKVLRVRGRMRHLRLSEVRASPNIRLLVVPVAVLVKVSRSCNVLGRLRRYFALGVLVLVLVKHSGPTKV